MKLDFKKVEINVGLRSFKAISISGFIVWVVDQEFQTRLNRTESLKLFVRNSGLQAFSDKEKLFQNIACLCELPLVKEFKAIGALMQRLIERTPEAKSDEDIMTLAAALASASNADSNVFFYGKADAEAAKILERFSQTTLDFYLDPESEDGKKYVYREDIVKRLRETDPKLVGGPEISKVGHRSRFSGFEFNWAADVTNSMTLKEIGETLTNKISQVISPLSSEDATSEIFSILENSARERLAKLSFSLATAADLYEVLTIRLVAIDAENYDVLFEQCVKEEAALVFKAINTDVNESLIQYVLHNNGSDIFMKPMMLETIRHEINIARQRCVGENAVDFNVAAMEAARHIVYFTKFTGIKRV